MGLFLLPVELLEVILVHLPVRDILICKLVCSALAQVVRGSSWIQYKLDLFAIGAIDGPECKLPIAEKSRRLKELQNAWRNPRFTSTYIIDCDPYMHAVLGDTVVQWTPTDDMHFIRIPSNIRLVHDDCWSINGPELGFQIYAPYGDPSQDLLAIVELTEEDEESYPGRIRLLSMLSHKPHPLAAEPILEADTSADDEAAASSLCISSDFILWQVIQAQFNGRSSRFRIWNWKTGTLLWDLQAHNGRVPIPTSFAFLDDQHILFSTIQRGNASLGIYRISGNRGRISNVDTLTHGYECLLELPRITDGCRVCEVWVALQNGLSPVPRTVPTAPFGIAPEDMLFGIVMGVRGIGLQHMETISMYNLFVPVSVLRSCLHRTQGGSGRRVWPWKEWGPTRTRMLPPTQHLHGVCGSILGWRAIIEQASTGRDLCYNVYDFNPYTLPRDLELAEEPATHSGGGRGSHVVNETSHIRTPNDFREVVSTSLPYRVTQVHVSVTSRPGEHIHTEAFLWEDGIAVVDRTEETCQYRFLTF